MLKSQSKKIGVKILKTFKLDEHMNFKQGHEVCCPLTVSVMFRLTCDSEHSSNSQNDDNGYIQIKIFERQRNK